MRKSFQFDIDQRREDRWRRKSFPFFAVTTCTSQSAALYVRNAMTSIEQRAYELHFMDCARCARHAESARTDLVTREEGRMNSRAWRAAQAINSTDVLWYHERRLKIARAVIGGATLKAAGELADISAERARQIVSLLTYRVLSSPDCPLPPLDLRPYGWSTDELRQHADWWLARLDALAVEWGLVRAPIEPPTSPVVAGGADDVLVSR